MKSGFSRREMMKAAGAAALSPAALTLAQEVSWPPAQGPNTPKICLGVRPDIDEAGMRRIKQIGVDYVLTGGPPIPWTEDAVRERINRYQAGGLTLCNMMISGFPNTLYGRPGPHEGIEKGRQALRAGRETGVAGSENKL